MQSRYDLQPDYSLHLFNNRMLTNIDLYRNCILTNISEL